ncbi:MAG TPA: hypothetical protein VIG68_01645, partial [Lysobacter sp.]
LVLALMLAGLWRWLGWAFAVELAAWLAVLSGVAPSSRWRMLGKGLAVAPLRYVDMAADAFGAVRFLAARVGVRRDA